MARALTIIGGVVAAILIAASASMNFIFARSLGQGPVDGVVLGVVSVALDVLKALLAVSIARAATEGRRAFVAIAGFVFILITLVSLTASVGFTASNRSFVTSEREQRSVDLRVSEAKLTRLRSRRDALPSHRAIGIVDEVLAGAKLDRQWQVTNECAAAKSSAGVRLCESVFRLRAERATASEAQRLDGAIETEEQRASELRKAGGGNEGDPQARLIAAAVGIEEIHARRLLMAMIAVVIEIVSGLGIYLVRERGPSSGAEASATINTTASAVPSRNSHHQVVVSARGNLGDRRRWRHDA